MLHAQTAWLATEGLGPAGVFLEKARATTQQFIFEHPSETSAEFPPRLIRPRWPLRAAAESEISLRKSEYFLPSLRIGTLFRACQAGGPPREPGELRDQSLARRRESAGQHHPSCREARSARPCSWAPQAGQWDFYPPRQDSPLFPSCGRAGRNQSSLSRKPTEYANPRWHLSLRGWRFDQKGCKTRRSCHPR